MSRRRRGEYTCDWCAAIGAFPAARIEARGRMGMSLLWLLCEPCLERVRQYRDSESFKSLRLDGSRLPWEAERC